jgi:hypothetical protein
MRMFQDLEAKGKN